MKQPRFVVYEDSAGEWRWRLIGANGRIVADSGEGYYSRSNAQRAARNLAVIAIRAPWLRIKAES